MRKLIFLFLLAFSNYVSAQISIGWVSPLSATTSNASSFGYSSATLLPGKLYFFIGITTGTTNPGTLSSTTQTWSSIVSIGDATRRLQIFRCMPTTTVTGEAINLSSFGGGSTGYIVGLMEVSGVVTTGTNGADAIIQTVTAGPTTSANPSITMAAISSNRNSVIAIFGNNTNVFGGAQEAGWNEDSDIGYNTPISGGYMMSRHLTTDNTPSITVSSTTWLGAAIELNEASIRKVRLITGK
jgi:hypothetical protein